MRDWGGGRLGIESPFSRARALSLSLVLSLSLSLCAESSSVADEWRLRQAQVQFMEIIGSIGGSGAQVTSRVKRSVNTGENGY